MSLRRVFCGGYSASLALAVALTLMGFTPASAAEPEPAKTVPATTPGQKGDAAKPKTEAPAKSPEPEKTGDKGSDSDKDEEPDPDEDDSVFDDEPGKPDTTKSDDTPEGAEPAGDLSEEEEEESVFTDGNDGPGIRPNELIPDRLAIGGQLYMRLSGSVVNQGNFGEQRLSMPNLLDLYLDARPVDRLRAYARARLTYDPTIGEDSTDFLGNPSEPLKVVLDQLWLKTDIARLIYITLGKQRVKWGESRIWNPTDFLNNTRRDPLAFFDERTGVNLLKLHIPIESLDWNIYLVGILDGVNQWDRAGGAARVEMVIGPTEWSLSFAAGKNMKTSFGIGVSAPIWEFDFSAELSITNESGKVRYTAPFASTVTDWFNNATAQDLTCVIDATTGPDGEPASDINIASVLGCVNPPTRTLDNWFARVSAGLTYALRYNDDDLMIFGLEYFYNSTGYGDADRYPWLLASGDFEPFNIGQHYAGFVWSVPAPGTWDDISFTSSTLGNLSDLSFVQRLSMSATFFTRLRLEIYAQFHFGKPGGELRFEFDIPQVLKDAGLPSTPLPHPIFDWGVNLRLAI